MDSKLPSTGKANNARPAPKAMPSMIPNTVSIITWVRKCAMIRALVAPRLRMMAIERCRSVT